MTYQGQPEYVRNGFLGDALAPWIEHVMPCDEWGDYVTALYRASQAAVSISQDEQTNILLNWVIDEISEAFESDWFGTRDDFAEDIIRAQQWLSSTIDDWRRQAVAFKGETILETTIENLPVWMKPSKAPEDLLRDKIEIEKSKFREIEYQLMQSRRRLTALEGRLLTAKLSRLEDVDPSTETGDRFVSPGLEEFD